MYGESTSALSDGKSVFFSEEFKVRQSECFWQELLPKFWR